MKYSLIAYCFIALVLTLAPQRGKSQQLSITHEDGTPLLYAYCPADTIIYIKGIPEGGIFTGCGVKETNGRWHFNPLTIAPQGGQTQRCSITYHNGSDSVRQEIMINFKFSVITTEQNPFFCSDSFYLSAHLSVVGAFKWWWTGDGIQSPDNHDTWVVNPNGGRYVFHATHLSSGCTARDTINVTVASSPLNLQITASDPTPETGSTITLHASAHTDFKIISWQSLQPFLDSQEKSRTYKIADSLAVWVEALDTENQCTEVVNFSLKAYPVSIESETEKISTPVISPNPATNILYINSPGAGSITIRGLSGKTLLEQPFDETRKTIDISSLAPGIYNVTLRNKALKVLYSEQLIRR